MVRELLDSETESAKKEHKTKINRENYNFIFLRRQNFGVVLEYVFAIFPKRKDKYFMRGQIWVDASGFHIRRIEGVPAKSPSFWIKNLHITLQFAELGGMWIPVTFDGIATLRLFGEYTLAALIFNHLMSLYPLRRNSHVRQSSAWSLRGSQLDERKGGFLYMKTKWQLSALFLGAVLVCGPAVVWSQQSSTSQDSGVKQDTKDAGHSVKQGTKKVYHKAKHGAKKAWHKTKNTTTGAVEGTKEGAKKPE
jgi:hypothetical protein